MPWYEKMEFYYSSSVSPDERYPCNIEGAIKGIEMLAGKGLDAKAIDVEELRDAFRAYHKALSIADPDRHSVFSKVRGDYRDLFGRAIPALLCYEKANDRVPSEVFPREEEGRLITVNEALERFLKGHGEHG